MVTGGDRRGQLVVIAAVLISVTVVGSIVLLNSIHESPGTYTRQDSRSLVGADRTAQQVHADLERVFLVNTSVGESNESLPYAREDSFGAIVEEYERQYVNLSTTDSAGITRIELVDNQTGGVARQTEPATGFRDFNGTVNPTVVVEDAAKIPRLSLVVTEANLTTSSEFTVRIEGGSGNETTITVGDDDVETNPNSGPTRSCDWGTEPVEIDLTNGTGAVRTNETYCEIHDAWDSLDAPLEVTFENGTDARGTFTVTGVGVDPADSDISGSPGDDRWYSTQVSGDDYIVNPVFRVEYRDPNIAYNTTFALYNGTGR